MKYNLEKINLEFQTAEKAIYEGNEGKARVCARRAVGFAIQEKFHSLGITVRTPELKKLSELFITEIDSTDELKTILEHMNWKVEYKKGATSTFWPYPEIDLVEEAKRFAKIILSD